MLRCAFCLQAHTALRHTACQTFLTTVCQTFRLKRLAKHSGSSSSFGSWTFTCARASPHSRILLYSTHPSELISLSSSIWTYLCELIHLNSSLWAHPGISNINANFFFKIADHDSDVTRFRNTHTYAAPHKMGTTISSHNLDIHCSVDVLNLWHLHSIDDISSSISRQLDQG